MATKPSTAQKSQPKPSGGSPLAKAVARVGQVFRLPDFGISERFTPKPPPPPPQPLRISTDAGIRYPTSGVQYQSGPSLINTSTGQPFSPPRLDTRPVLTPPTQGVQYLQGGPTASRAPVGGGGGGGASRVTTTSQQQNRDEGGGGGGGAQPAQQTEEAPDYERYAGQIREGFAPIFSELDRQLGELGGLRGEQERSIEEMAGLQRGDVERSRAQGISRLGEAETGELERRQGSLRDLEGNIRNQLQAAGVYLGSLGAGDSSATGQASEAVQRAGLKARSGVLSESNQALREIGLKKVDVENLASDQLSKIGQWKAKTVADIGQFFATQANQLNMAKANASGEQARAINDRIFGLERDFINRMRQLDDQSRQYQQGIDTWKMQRQAELDDYGQRLAITAQYQTRGGGGGGGGGGGINPLTLFSALAGKGADPAAALQASGLGGGFTAGDLGALFPKSQKDIYEEQQALIGQAALSQGLTPEQYLAQQQEQQRIANDTGISATLRGLGGAIRSIW